MDKKLTDSEILKALECCIGFDSCEERQCPMAKECDKDIDSSYKYALDLINRQKAEIESLIKLNKLESEIVADKGKEIERLKGHQKDGFFNLLGNCLVFSKTLKDYNDMRKGLKAEAYKEFVNKIKVHAYYVDFQKEYRVVDEDDIDNLLKEMEGKNNECQNK